jgi:uncharacterized protein (DUF3084 family)
MQTTILIMLLIAISSFAAGWYFKQQDISKTMKKILEDIQNSIKVQKQQLAGANEVFNMSEHKEQIHANILRLTEHQNKVQLMVQEIEQDYLEKLKIIETTNQQTKNDTKQRLEKLKSKSSALKQ